MISGTPAPSAPGKSVQRDRWVPLLMLAGLVLWQLSPMLSPHFFGQAILGTDSYRSHDWLEVAKFDHYARISLLEWGRWPLWNPLVAGGLPQFAHPSDGSAGPLILSSLLLGEIAGMKANILLVALLGTWGVFELLRGVLRLSPSSAFVGAACYAGSGWLASRVAVGFYESCLMAAWPAILALWLLPGPLHIRRRRWTAGALLLWALSIQLQLAVPVLVLLMAVLAAALAVQDRLAGRPFDRPRLLGGTLILVLAGLLGIRLDPRAVGRAEVRPLLDPARGPFAVDGVVLLGNRTLSATWDEAAGFAVYVDGVVRNRSDTVVPLWVDLE